MSVERQKRIRNREEGAAEAVRFRIIQINGHRRAFSLEPIFWTIMEDIAKSQNISLGDFIARVIANKGEANMSSALRTATTGSIWDKLNESRAHRLSSLANRVVATIPVPAFIVDQNRKVISHNPAFLTLLKLDTRDPANPPQIEVRLGAPIAQLVHLFEQNSGAVFKLDFKISSGTSVISGKLNATLFEKVEADARIMCVFGNVQDSI